MDRDALLAQAASLLGDNVGLSEPEPRHTDAVVSSAYDRLMYSSLQEQTQRLNRMADDLGEDMPFADDLVRDTWTHLFSNEPKVRDASQMEDTHLENHVAQRALEQSAEVRDLRKFTVEDSYNAALGALSTADAVKSAILQHRERIEDAKNERDEAQQQCDGSMPGNGVDGLDDLSDEELQSLIEQMLAAQAAQQKLDQALEQAAKDASSGAGAAAAETAEQAEGDGNLAGGWCYEPGDLRRMEFEQRWNLMQQLNRSKLAKYKLLIGRHLRMAEAMRAKKVIDAPHHATGTTFGDDVAQMVSTEFMAMQDDNLQDDFYARWASQELLLAEYEGEEEIGHGAVVYAADGSGSMAGEPEAWSKALGLALLHQSRKSKRDFVGILFSSYSEIRVWRFPHDKPIDQVALGEFVEWFFNGGTDFERPLTTATNIIEADYNDAGKARADMVFVTDGQARVSQAFLERLEQIKETVGFRIWGIQVGGYGNSNSLEPFCDNVRTIRDFVDATEVDDIFRNIR